MNAKDYKQLTESRHKLITETFDKKSHDYADKDVLSNFKRVSAVCKLLRVDVGTPAGATLFFVVQKLDRIQNLLSNNTNPANESLADSVMDLQNYVNLWYANLVESKQIEVKK